MKPIWGVLTVLTLLLSACDSKEEDSGQAQARDSQAREYRYLYDNSEGELQSRRFVGQLRMVDAQDLFGSLEELPQDNYGNHVSGWLNRDGRLWSLVADPSLRAINVMSIDSDGTISSALDSDGDGAADVVDIRPATGGRFTFLTEQIGLGIFEEWLRGRNPLCDEKVVANIALPAFGCPQQGGSGSNGGGSSVPSDPFADICAEYRDSNRFSSTPGTLAHGGHGYGSRASHGATIGGSEGGRSLESTTVYRDSDGNHVSTTRETVYYDRSGDPVRRIQETVDHEGNGNRRIIDYGADGSTKSEEETFTTEVDDDGYFGPEAPEDHPRAPESHRESNGEDGNGDNRPPPDEGENTGGGSETNPGPIDAQDPASMAEWCERTGGSQPSGAEQAADSNPGAFQVACDDLVRADGDDCVIVEWAGEADFDGAMATPAQAGGCGNFEQPGPGGTCGPASGVERLRGHIAWIVSLQMPEVEICNPLVCNPGQ